MFRIPRFLIPHRSIVNILRINAGFIKKTNIHKLERSIDVYKEPLPIVFMLAMAIHKLNPSLLSKQLLGVLNYTRFRNAMNMAAFQKICKLFTKHNIPILAQKGLVQKLLFPQTIRPMNDADFAVPKDIYRKSIELAVEDGFHINHDMIGSADLQYKDQGCIDIHYALFKGANPKMDDTIWYRSQKVPYCGTEISIPCPEDILVIILCEFYGNFIYEAGSKKTDPAQIFANHPQWVLDAYKIIVENPELSWGKVMHTANMSGYDYQIKILTKLLNKILPNTISKHAAKIIDFMCPDEVVKKYLKRDKKIVKIYKANHKLYKKQQLQTI